MADMTPTPWGPHPGEYDGEATERRYPGAGLAALAFDDGSWMVWRRHQGMERGKWYADGAGACGDDCSSDLRADAEDAADLALARLLAEMAAEVPRV